MSYDPLPYAGGGDVLVNGLLSFYLLPESDAPGAHCALYGQFERTIGINTNAPAAALALWGSSVSVPLVDGRIVEWNPNLGNLVPTAITPDAADPNACWLFTGTPDGTLHAAISVEDATSLFNGGGGG